MDKFVCQGCGVCCKEESLNDDKTEYPRFSPNSFIYYYHKPTLSLFEWEAKTLQEEAKKQSVELTIVPYRVIYDQKNKVSLVIQYTFKETACPFFKKNKCSIYDKRALVCKFFPVQLGSVSDLMKGMNKFKMSVCPNDMTREQWADFLGAKINTKEFVSNMNERYGESYLALLERDLLLKEANDWAKYIVDLGLVEPATPENSNVEKIKKKIEKYPQVSLIDFMIKHTGINVLSFINESKDLKHAKLFVNNLKK